MESVNYKGAEALLVSSVTHYFYQLVAPAVAIDAIWAYLNTSEVRRRGWNDIQGMQLEERVKYKRYNTRLPSGMMEMIMVHPCCLANWPESTFVIISKNGSEGPPKGFFERLNAGLHLPLLKEWEDYLWEEGKKAEARYTKLVKDLQGTGIQGYMVMAGATKTWHKILKEGLQSGKIRI